MVARSQPKSTLHGAHTEAEPAAAFTPGPWHIKPGDLPGFKTHSGKPGIYAPARPQDDFFILQIAELATNVPGQEIAANARLIAAAPDLLEALKYARRFVKPADVDTDFIDAAIAKATDQSTTPKGA